MGIIMSYLFILAGIVSGVYPQDPKELAGKLFYSVYMNITGICMFMVPIGGVYLMYLLIYANQESKDTRNKSSGEFSEKM